MSDYLLGILTGLLTQYISIRFKLAYDLNRMRIALDAYFKGIILRDLKKYVIECDKTIEYIENLFEENENILITDSLPSLTGEFLNSYPLPVLRQVIQNNKIFTNYIEIHTAINYLKNKNPEKIFDQYRENCENHFIEKGIKMFDDQINHVKIQKCSSIPIYTSDAIISINHKRKLAIQIQDEINNLKNYFSGSNFKWMIAYSVGIYFNKIKK